MNLADGFPIDLPVLLESRLLVQANSGGGKSYLLRRLLEQTATSVQQLVIDPEGEFATLRERFDYVIAAPRGADAVATPATAALLARRLLESGVSAILDIYELKAHERVQFVRRFLDALVNAPKALWHPVMVVLDEAHVYAPQVGSAESLSAVQDLATRGRKRGQALVCATQRLSKLHKDVAAEMGNKLIGRTGLDVDVKRAADELGLTAREALADLRNLDAGEFFAFGPALSRTVKRLRVGRVLTTHPKPGHRVIAAPPPASAALRNQLAKLSDLQKDAEEEARTIDELRVQLDAAQRAARAAEKRAEQSGVPEHDVQRRVREALEQGRSEGKSEAAPGGSATPAEVRALQEIGRIGNAALVASLPKRRDRDATIAHAPLAAIAGRAERITARAEGSLSRPEQRILDAIAWMESIGVDEPEQPAVAFLAGYTHGAGAYNNTRGRLRQEGRVEYLPGDRIRLTDGGRALAARPEAPATTDELHARVLAKLPNPEQRLLRPLLDAYPSAMTNADLAAAANYTPGAGAFNNTRGRLRTLGLIDYPAPGQCVARALLFPKS